MKILTCNIRCFGAKDGANNWVCRRDLCATVIRSQSPDIICFQEMWGEQFADLSRALPAYRSYGLLDEPLCDRPSNGIFYRADLFTPLSASGYWLSETPHVAGSRSWDSDCVRLANWIRLRHQATGADFRVVNTHLDHIGQLARERQAKMIVEDAGAYPDGYPQILTGDMNCDARNPAISLFKANGWIDTYGARHGTENPGHTYHAFLGAQYQSKVGKMDWIFVRGGIRTLDAAIITDSADGRFPSDHYFVSATIALQAVALQA